MTIATLYTGNFVKDWHVNEEVSCSDHKYIRITITVTDLSVEVYRNPRRTDWGSFRTDLSVCLGNITDRITDFMDLEVAAGQSQDAIVSAHNDNCPLTVRRNNRYVP
jgi:hypothetical protein